MLSSADQNLSLPFPGRIIMIHSQGVTDINRDDLQSN